jgi:hypothetical protein
MRRLREINLRFKKPPLHPTALSVPCRARVCVSPALASPVSHLIVSLRHQLPRPLDPSMSLCRMAEMHIRI